MTRDASALSQRDSMPDESPAMQRRTSSTTTAAYAGSGTSRQPSGSARTGIRPDGTVPPGNVPACRKVPGFAGRSLMSAGCDPATVTRTLAIAVPDGAGEAWPRQ